METLLVATGLLVVGLALWRSYAAVRLAVGPLVHDRDPTRTLVDASRPVHERYRVRSFARGVTLSVGWLMVALYGLFLVSVGLSGGGP